MSGVNILRSVHTFPAGIQGRSVMEVLVLLFKKKSEKALGLHKKGGALVREPRSFSFQPPSLGAVVRR